MTKLWPNYDQTMTKLWPNYNQTITKPWPNYDQTMTKLWPNHDQTMTKLWPNYDQTMTKPWPNHDQTMTKPWPNNDQTMTKLWPNYDQTMTKLWPNHDQTMTKPWPTPRLSQTMANTSTERDPAFTQFCSKTSKTVGQHWNSIGWILAFAGKAFTPGPVAADANMGWQQDANPLAVECWSHHARGLQSNILGHTKENRIRFYFP